MPAWICRTCGVQHPDTEYPPQACAICEDERQYVGWDGQQWTTMTDLARERRVVLRDEESDLVRIPGGVRRRFRRPPPHPARRSAVDPAALTTD